MELVRFLTGFWRPNNDDNDDDMMIIYAKLSK